MTTIGARSAIFIPTAPRGRVRGSSPIDKNEPRNHGTGPRYAHIRIAGKIPSNGAVANPDCVSTSTLPVSLRVAMPQLIPMARSRLSATNPSCQKAVAPCG